MSARYLRVKNHDQYQHYSTRNPPWIKLYRSILGDYDLRQVSEKSRLCFIYLTVIACETDNKIPEDLKYLSERFGFSVTKAILTPLIERGLLLASGASDLLAHDALCSSLSSSSPKGIGKTERKGRQTDEEWMAALRVNPLYAHIDLDRELTKMDQWLANKPGRKKTRSFMFNWLNKIEPPVSNGHGGLTCTDCGKVFPDAKQLRSHRFGYHPTFVG